jgi:DNA-binding IclR family transcriptional regulator
MSGNQSIKRAFAILKAVAAFDEGIRVNEIAERVGLHKSTVSRMLATLEAVYAVERLPDREGFRIGPEIIALASQVDYPRHLITVARPFLLKLAEATGETVNLCLPENDFAHYIDQIDSQYNLQIRNWTGYRLPMHATCDGKVFLSYRTQESLERYLSHTLSRFTPQTITNPDQLREQLTEIRAQGYAWTQGEYEAGIVGLAVPVWDEDGHVVASVCVGGPDFRFPRQDEANNVVSLLKEASQEISKRIGIGQSSLQRTKNSNDAG